MTSPHWLRQLYAYRQTLWIILPPLLLLPIPCALPGTVAACGYCILLMAIYWVSEALPLAVTAFLPLIIFPISGIMDANDVSAAYFKDTTFLFIGGLMIAISVEVSGLHKRIALKVLLIVGPKPHALMFGFMFTTFFLSMWISNTATTAMMLPIIEAVFNEMKSTDQITSGKPQKEELPDDVTSDGKEVAMTSFHSDAFKVGYMTSSLQGDDGEYDDIKTPTSQISKREDIESQDGAEELSKEELKRLEKLERFVKGITISVPYSASIGGTVTLTGTGPNLVLAGQFETLFPDADVSLSFGNWIAYNVAGASVLLFLAYVWLTFYYLGIDFRSCCGNKGERNESERKVKSIIEREYAKLGDIKWGESTVAVVFIMTVLLWFFREPGFIPGYALIFPVPDYPGDGTVAMLMATLLFVLPGERPEFLRKREVSENEGDDDCDEEKLCRPVDGVLVWKTVQHKFPWDILFLIAGGFALADGSQASGFSEWMGEQLTFLEVIEPWAISLTVTIIVCIFTECSSNAATASLFVPILAELARKVRVHPLYLMIPPVLASSLAFMLPVATPPNAIAFSYGHLKVVDLVKAGWLMNILGIAVISIFINTYGMAFWNLGSFPEWAEYPNSTITT